MRLVSYTERFLNITGIKVVIGTSGADDMRNPPEELFNHFIKLYRPYISDKRIFMRKILTGRPAALSRLILVMRFFIGAWLLLFLLTGGKIFFYKFLLFVATILIHSFPCQIHSSMHIAIFSVLSFIARHQGNKFPHWKSPW